MRFHIARLALCAAVVAGGYLLAAGHQPRGLFAPVVALAAAVLCAPAALLSLEGIARARRWGRWADEAVRAATTVPVRGTLPTRPTGWQGGRTGSTVPVGTAPPAPPVRLRPLPAAGSSAGRPRGG